MKIAVVFYSFTGNTEKIAGNIRSRLKTGHDLEFFKLEPEKEETAFFRQARQAFFQRKVSLKDAPRDLSLYDLIFIGSPVWAFKPAPAIKAFLAKAVFPAGKKAVIFFTYGSGAGVNHCVKFTAKMLAAKGMLVTKHFVFPQSKIGDEKEIDKELSVFLKGLV